jgi:hypothetical protein
MRLDGGTVYALPVTTCSGASISLRLTRLLSHSLLQAKENGKKEHKIEI